MVKYALGLKKQLRLGPRISMPRRKLYLSLNYSQNYTRGFCSSVSARSLEVVGLMYSRASECKISHCPAPDFSSVVPQWSIIEVIGQEYTINLTTICLRRHLNNIIYPAYGVIIEIGRHRAIAQSVGGYYYHYSFSNA